MGRKCSVFGCNSGYDNQEKKISIFKFPDDEEECRQWIACLPNNIQNVTKFMGICALHWPAETPLVRKKGGRYPSPAVPPSLFPNTSDPTVPSNTSSSPAPTERTLSSVINADIDEMISFNFKQQDSLKSDSFKVLLTEGFSNVGHLMFKDDTCILLSEDRNGSVHSFSVYLKEQSLSSAANTITVSYEAYHGIKRVFHPSLQKDLKYWSQVEEVIRFIMYYSVEEDDLKFVFLSEATPSHNSSKVYINAQDIMSPHAIKLMIECETESIDHKNDRHSCEFCLKPLTDYELLVIDDLPEKIEEISKDVRMALFYVGGYICQKHPEHVGLLGDPSLLSNFISGYSDELDRGGLLFPSEGLFQLLCFIYTFFVNISHKKSCRRRLAKIFTDFPAIFHLDIDMPRQAIARIVNIMLTRFGKTHNSDEGHLNKKRKMAKLASTSQS